MTGLWKAWAVLSLVVCIYALLADRDALLGGAAVGLVASVALLIDHEGVATRNRPGLSLTQRRLIIAGVTAYVLIGAVVGELRDPPFHVVRFLFSLVVDTVIVGLTALFLVWFFLRTKD